MMVVNLVKNLLIAQNKHLLECISKDYNLNVDDMLATYLQPEFYLAVFEKQLLKRQNDR